MKISQLVKLSERVAHAIAASKYNGKPTYAANAIPTPSDHKYASAAIAAIAEGLDLDAAVAEATTVDGAPPVRLTVTLIPNLGPGGVQVVLRNITETWGVQAAEVQCMHGEDDVCEDCDGFGL